MKKIKDLQIGETVKITLLVKSSEIKYTKDNKPYLALELFDGRDNIHGRHWDYYENDTFEENTVLDIVATVREWNENKDLNVSKITVNQTIKPYDFLPKGNFDLEDYKNKLNELINEISNLHLKEIVKKAFNDYMDLWLIAPAAKKNHHAFVGGNLKHSVDVAIKARALAYTIPEANVDLCIAGGLLQDFGKLWTYKFDGVLIDMTTQGQMLDHIVIGIRELEKYRTKENSDIMDLLQHIIASHHSKLEWGSPVTPLFLEAWIVSCADMLDAKVQVICELNEKAVNGQLEKTHLLEGRSNFSIDYVKRIMK